MAPELGGRARPGLRSPRGPGTIREMDQGARRGPRARPERGRVRVTLDGRSYLLNLPTVSAFREAWARALEVVARGLPPERTRRAGLSEAHAEGVRREIAMHWLYAHAVNGLPVAITAADLRAPSTWRILVAAAERAAGPRGDARAAAAILAGVSEAHIDRFLAAEARLRER